jgi:hypothetical protein
MTTSAHPSLNLKFLMLRSLNHSQMCQRAFQSCHYVTRQTAYVAIRKLSDLTPEPTNAAQLPPSTFSLDELVSNVS